MDLHTTNLIYWLRRVKRNGADGNLNKTDRRILDLLSQNGPLTLYEIAERLNMKPKAVFRSLRRLFENEMISCDPRTRRYFIEKEHADSPK